MVKKYLQTAFRSLQKNKFYSGTNILGLTVGLWACMIVASIVINDLSYDKQWSRSNDLYRIVTINKMGDGLYDRFASSFAGLAPELKKKYPEVEAYSQFDAGPLRLKLTDDNANGFEVNSLSADTSAWQMLDIQPVAGNPGKFVDGSLNLIVSTSFKNKYFSGENPVGKIIYDVPSFQEKANQYLITGVMNDLPSNTHLRAEVLIVKKPGAEVLNKEQYGTFSQNYLLMQPGTDIKLFAKKVNDWYKGFIGSDKYYQFEFQPMKDIYLNSDFARYQKVKGNIQHIYVFSGVALLLLLIACVNFINLSTARVTARLRETGVRKILGASRLQIIFQFLSEAVLFFLISTSLAMVLYQISLKPVEDYLGYALEETFTSRINLLLPAVGFIFVISLFTGFYPAWLMSGFKPASVIKGKLFTGASYGQYWLRKSLVVLQFTISIAVLLAMIVVKQQVLFMDKKEIGYNKNNLLSIGSISWDGKGNAFKNELLRVPGVEDACLTTWLPASGAGYMSREVDNPDHPGTRMTVWYISAETNLAKTLGLKLNDGRLLSKDYASDIISEDSLMQLSATEYNKVSETRAAIVTESTAKLLHIDKLNVPVSNVKVVPVGIVKDFHNESLKSKIGPVIIIGSNSLEYGGMLVRTAPGNEKKVSAALQKLWMQFYPDKFLDTNWVDDMLAGQYKSEASLQQLFLFFSILTMMLAALGVFGLIVHTAGERVKEIGIRKVLGASVVSIVRLLSADFIKLVFVAILIATPLVSWLMSKWLQEFAYRITMSWWMFAFAGSIAIFIALITISFQSIKAAVANPVKSLRTE